MCCSQDPLGANEGGTTEILVQGVDQCHLPAPLAVLSVLSSDHTSSTSAAVIAGIGIVDSATAIVIRIDDSCLLLGLLLIGSQLIALHSAGIHQIAQLIVVDLDGHNGGAEHQTLVGFVEVAAAAGIGHGQLSRGALHAVLGTGIGDQGESRRAAGASSA